MTAAAALLGVDHTTVKRRIDRLEAALGVRLLDRGADGWELTPIGRDVVARASSLDDVVEQVIVAASSDDGSVRGTVRVSAPDAFSALFAAPALAKVRALHPGVTTELVTTTRPLSVRGSGYDISVTIGTASHSRVPSEFLASYSLRLYASPDYLRSHPAIESFADLENHSLVFYVDGLLTVHELDLAPVLGGMPVGFGATSVFAQLEATRRGAGIGLLHAFMAEHDPGLVRVLPGMVDFRLQFSLSVRKDSPAVEAVALVRDALRDEVRLRGDELLPI